MKRIVIIFIMLLFLAGCTFQFSIVGDNHREFGTADVEGKIDTEIKDAIKAEDFGKDNTATIKKETKKKKLLGVF